MFSTTSRPPKGFELSHTPEGYQRIKFRNTGKIAVGIFYAVWLTVWTFGCVSMTKNALSAPEGINAGLLLFSIPFWAAEFLVIGHVIWYFGSVRSFEFRSDNLIVARTCLKYKKEREIFRDGITRIRQVRDSGKGTDARFGTWGIVIEADKKYKILHGQQAERSEWLGRVIENWAAKEYIPWQDESKGVESI